MGGLLSERSLCLTGHQKLTTARRRQVPKPWRRAARQRARL